jgi:integrase
MGRSKLKRGLQTDSLRVANSLRWSVVAEFKKQIRLAAQGTLHDPLLEEALLMREEYVKHDSHGYNDFCPVSEAITERAHEIAGDPLDEDPATGEPVFDREREARADFYYKVATGQETPLAAFVEQWHLQEVNRKERTKGDDRRALRYLEDWAKSKGVNPAIEAIKRKVAERFASDLPRIASTATDGQPLANRTTNKYLSSLSSYWNWLKSRDMVEENVWRGLFLRKERRDPDEREREFKDHEVKALLSGSPGMVSLGPIMRIAALTGARIDAIVSLRVKDCENGLFRFKPQKREVRERYVPIHSALVPLVKDLMRGKGRDDDLIPGFPIPPPGSQRERSMPAVKAFTTYRRSVGVDERLPGRKRSLVNFHSFRRWFCTKAEQAGIPETTIAAVVGHKRQGETFGTYSAGPSREQFRACVEAVKLP